MLQANHPYGQEQKDFEDGIEYRPLPSPTRSSLRSPDRSGSVRGKEGVRVTFAERSLPDFSPKKDIFAKYSENGSDVKSTSKPLYGNTDKAGTSFVSRDGSQRSSTNTYLTSTPLKTKISTSNQRIKDKNNIIDSIGKHKDLKDFLKPSYKDEEESSSERLLRVSSDLYVSTHMNDAPFSSVPLSNLRKGFGDAYTLPSKPTLGQSHLSTFKMGSQLEFKDHKIAWNPEKLSSFTTESTPILQTEMKRSSSLNCLLSQKPDSAYKGRHTDDLLSNNGLKEKDSTLGSEAASTMDVLQQLMDLVDCYWNGSGSLHQNQRFLVPALQLLSRCLFGDRNKTVTTKTIYGQAEDSVNMELKQKLHKVMEENQVLQSKISKLENKATEMLPASQDELWQKYEKLSLQVESLQQQLKQTHKIQETVNLLHDSQRSLVSTNEYLLQQLNKTSPIHVSKTAPAPTKARSRCANKGFSSFKVQTSALLIFFQRRIAMLPDVIVFV
ncbi:leucine-rich repeat-containing protein 36-like [Rhinophrynus dorsalis]